MNLKEIFATFGLDFDQSGFDQAEGSIAKLKVIVKSFGAVLASAALLKGLSDFVSGIMHASAEVSTLSARAGVGTAEFQRFAAALAPLGLGAENTSKALEELGIKAAEAAQGGGARETFARLGVSVKDAAGNVRSGSDLFLEVTDRIAGLGSASERAAALNQLMAEEGRRLGPALAGGSNQIRGMVEAMGGLEGLTPDVIAQSQQMSGQFAVLDLATTSLKNELARVLLPVVLGIVKGLTKFARSAVQVTRESNIMKATVAVMGAALVGWGASTAAAWLPATLTFLGIAAAIAFVILVVDDLITMFNGGESAIGGLIDSMLGAGSAALFVEGVKLAWDNVGTAIGDAVTKLDSWNDSYANFLGQSLIMTETMFTDITETWGMIGDSIAEVFTNVRDTVTGVFSDIREEWGAIFGAAGDGLRDSMDAASQAARGGGGGVMQGIARRDAARATQATAVVPGGPRGPTQVQQTTTVPITIQGNPSQAELNRVRAIVDGVLDQRNREAQAALIPEPR